MHTDHTTVFSTAEFVNSWCRAFAGYQPVALEVQGSGPTRVMHMVKEPLNYGSWTISGPRAHDLWTSPGWVGELRRGTVEHLLHQLKGLRTRSLQWQVRFDHEPLAIILSALSLAHNRVQIHVLNLNHDYDVLFGNYSASTRNHVRKAVRRGVIVSTTHDPRDVLSYHAIYSKHAQTKNWGFEYPAKLTLDLIKSPQNACLKVARYNEAIIGGALFIRDGNSIYYLHGIGDRDYSHLFPASVVLDAGIQWACEVGAHFFNLGNSGVESINKSLASFKSSWGAHTEQNWLFHWKNPLWSYLARLKSGTSRRVR